MKNKRTSFLTTLQRAARLAHQTNTQKITIDDALEQEAKSLLRRRDFIKNTAFVGASAYFLPNFIKNIHSAKPRVAIVGAGLAGLTAAFYLKQAGIEATIFEADKRVGGRIKSKKIFGNGELVTEIGGEFIDTYNKDLIRLAKLLDLWENPIDVQADTLPNKELFHFGNQNYALKDVIEALKPVIKKINRDANALGDNYETPRAKALDNQSLAEYTENLPLPRWTKDMLFAAHLGEQGLDSAELSSISLVESLVVEDGELSLFGESDERYKIRGGNQTIPETLAIGMLSQCRFEHQLVALKEHANGTFTLSFDTNGRVVEQAFDTVIVAIPFTILRGVGFDMVLPTDKKQVINELAYGVNTKVILEYSERVWRKQNYQGFLFNETLHNGWDSAQMQGENNGFGTFSILLGGAAARSPQPVETYIDNLDGIFKGSKAAQTGASEIANWGQNPFVKASYSSMSIGQYTQFYGKAGESVRNLHFAGEHCSRDFWGFMNGAAESGRIASERILKKMKLLKP